MLYSKTESKIFCRFYASSLIKEQEIYICLRKLPYRCSEDIYPIGISPVFSYFVIQISLERPGFEPLLEPSSLFIFKHFYNLENVGIISYAIKTANNTLRSLMIDMLHSAPNTFILFVKLMVCNLMRIQIDSVVLVNIQHI